MAQSVWQRVVMCCGWTLRPHLAVANSTFHAVQLLIPTASVLFHGHTAQQIAEVFNVTTENFHIDLYRIDVELLRHIKHFSHLLCRVFMEQHRVGISS